MAPASFYAKRLPQSNLGRLLRRKLRQPNQRKMIANP
jgi:hypothetical protein